MIELVIFVVFAVVVVGAVLDVRQSHRTSNLLTSEQLKTSLDNQKQSLTGSFKRMIEGQPEALQYDTRFETVVEGFLDQMHHTPMEVTHPVLYDLLAYVVKFRYGEDRLCDEVYLRPTQQRHLKEEVHYLSIRPE